MLGECRRVARRRTLRTVLVTPCLSLTLRHSWQLRVPNSALAPTTAHNTAYMVHAATNKQPVALPSSSVELVQIPLSPGFHSSCAGTRGARHQKKIVAACIVALLVCAGLLIGLLVGLLPGKRGSSSSSTSSSSLDTRDVSQLQQLPPPGSDAAIRLQGDPATPGRMSCKILRCKLSSAAE
jgi:hypothetical protein